MKIKKDKMKQQLAKENKHRKKQTRQAAEKEENTGDGLNQNANISTLSTIATLRFQLYTGALAVDVNVCRGIFFKFLRATIVRV